MTMSVIKVYTLKLRQSHSQVVFMHLYRQLLYVQNGVKGSMAESYGIVGLLGRDFGESLGGSVTPQGWQMRNAIFSHPRPSMHGEEPYPMRGDPVKLNTADLKEKTLKNNPQSYGVWAVPM